MRRNEKRVKRGQMPAVISLVANKKTFIEKKNTANNQRKKKLGGPSASAERKGGRFQKGENRATPFGLGKGLFPGGLWRQARRKEGKGFGGAAEEAGRQSWRDAPE